MLFKFLHNVKHVLDQERDIIIHVIVKKNKTRHKIKFFVFLKIFNVFFFNKKQPKTETKHVHKQLIELNQGQVSNIHLRESFLTHLARVFGFVGENPCEAQCI